MEIINWLYRKYPDSNGLIQKTFNARTIEEYIKILKYKVAVLDEDYRYDSFDMVIYPKGSLFLTRHYKAYEDEGWTGEFDTHCLFKCAEGFTPSGYHSFNAYRIKYTIKLS